MVTFKRSKSREPGTYRQWPPDPVGILADLVCTEGHLSSMLASRHRVSDDGVVTPSFACAYAGCNFKDWIRFDGWRPSGERR